MFVALAGLRSHGKGANKTPPDWVAYRLPPSRMRPVRSPSRGRVFWGLTRQRHCSVGGLNGYTEEGRRTVATMSSAEPTRRDFLYIATGAVAGVGAAAALVPLIAQMNPDASTIAAGAPVEVDLAPVAEGQVIKVFWRGKPIFVNHRTKKQIEEAENVNVASLPDPQPDSARVKAGHAQWQVLIGICTHLGCIPIAHQGEYDGYFCPCHGSVYDTSGRIRQGPAPSNLPLPPYQFLSDTRIRIGEV
jgi:ubiquinol-cytochrome c reductase iron-sulfur subunit